MIIIVHRGICMYGLFCFKEGELCHYWEAAITGMASEAMCAICFFWVDGYLEVFKAVSNN